jgi:uncharacterized protein (TIGR02266 family)
LKSKKKYYEKNNWGGKERRKSPRYAAAFHLHLVFDDLDELRNAYTRDISEGGVFVATEQPLPISSLVKLKISLVHEDLTYIKAEGEVVHVVKPGSRSQPGMGVKFVKICDESKQFLKEYILNNIEKSTKPEDVIDNAVKAKPEELDKTLASAKKTGTGSKKGKKKQR